MKIDPNIQPTGERPSDAVSGARNGSGRSFASKADQSSSANSEDSLQISSRHAEVQQLTAQLANVPEVRPARVGPLKAAVQQNAYQPDSGGIADAMLAEYASTGAKA